MDTFLSQAGAEWKEGFPELQKIKAAHLAASGLDNTFLTLFVLFPKGVLSSHRGPYIVPDFIEPFLAFSCKIEPLATLVVDCKKFSVHFFNKNLSACIRFFNGQKPTS